MIVGKGDLANTYKILAKDEKAGGFWIAGGNYGNLGYNYPLARLILCNNYDYRDNYGVGWFVL